MSCSRRNEHVITMRRPSAGTRWGVYPPRVDSPPAGDDDARRATRPRLARVQPELAGQLMLRALDLQAADSPPSSRDPDQQLGPEADLREGPGVQEAGPRQQPVQG